MKVPLSLFAYSLIHLPNGFWWGFVASLLATFVVLVFGWLGRGSRRVLKMYGRFSLAGIWIGTCKLPNYPPDVEAIEIYRLALSGEHVSFKFFNYRPDRREVLKYLGAGVCRGHLLSSFYYIPDSDSSESGVFAVRKRGEILKGVYAQYDLRADETLKVSPENFSLMRTKIPFWRRVKMVLGRQPYCSYNDVKDLYDAALAKHQPRGASAVEAGSQSLT